MAAEESKTLAFIPLEANPPLLTSLLHKLGVSPALAVHDVYSLDDPDLLAFVPRPALALLLVFPITDKYETHRREEDADKPDYEGGSGEDNVLWFQQTIRNATQLHPRHPPQASRPLTRRDRSALLEQSEALATAHRETASQGDTAAPQATDDVDLHYVCFVKTEDGRLWELDGRRKAPRAPRGHGPDDDVLSEAALKAGPLEFLGREGGDLRFSCVALAGALD
ncbi:unnamed protein product [Parascedosporium putredinis]|uniref:Ubiquitin carboxyl-terminal hydrolase n=1 Tax=Parascedosporium putredinis TaxID=1442378 RepID=A0A9P1GXI0_9PEZI|nr:unnamed protein product [Parascedosporium putredinis]CAI7990629.1 unnamed protein product [Parascedosporium putredinis]